MAVLNDFTGSGNELIAIVGYCVVLASLVWTGGQVLSAIISRYRNKD